MSVMEWFMVNIDYCNEVKKNENESLWDLGSYGALTMPFMMVLKWY